MTGVLVDSNVLLDVMTGDARWADWSTNAMRAAANHSRLVINPVIFAEVSVRFTRIEDLDEVLPRTSFDREALPYEAGFLAGKAFVDYKRRGGVRSAPLSDFFIGAHAVVAGYPLVTRDTTPYRTYFPKLELIAPD